jgi:hypothetical protein
MQIVNQKGKLQKINVMVCTYNEDCETVEKCVRHLLQSPEPVYCSKHIYIGDDGYKKDNLRALSKEKGEMVKRLHAGARARWIGLCTQTWHACLMLAPPAFNCLTVLLRASLSVASLLQPQAACGTRTPRCSCKSFSLTRPACALQRATRT